MNSRIAFVGAALLTDLASAVKALLGEIRP